MMKTYFLFLSGLIAAELPAAQVLTQKLNLEKLRAKAVESVEVSLDSNMLRFAAKFLSNDKPDEAKVKKLINGLKGVYVRSFQFEKEGEYSESEVDAIRAQLKPPLWSRIVGARSKKEGENAEIFTRTENGQIVGLAIIATEPKELTVVDIGGTIDLGDLSEMGGHFGVPKLKLNTDSKTRKGGSK
jgi:hypothetical protein